jgi:hypothetical protein
MAAEPQGSRQRGPIRYRRRVAARRISKRTRSPCVAEAPLEAMVPVASTDRPHSFVVTFVCARIVVFLIMTRDIPDLYIHVGGTHVHHLNFGILPALHRWARRCCFPLPPGKWRDVVAAQSLRRGIGPHLRRVRHVVAHGRAATGNAVVSMAITVIAAMARPRRLHTTAHAVEPAPAGWTLLLLCLVGPLLLAPVVALSPIEGRAMPSSSRSSAKPRVEHSLAVPRSPVRRNARAQSGNGRPP